MENTKHFYFNIGQDVDTFAYTWEKYQSQIIILIKVITVLINMFVYM